MVLLLQIKLLSCYKKTSNTFKATKNWSISLITWTHDTVRWSPMAQKRLKIMIVKIHILPKPDTDLGNVPENLILTPKYRHLDPTLEINY